MGLHSFFEALDADSLRHAMDGATGDHERLPISCAVVHPASRAALAQVLGISENALAAVLAGTLAYRRVDGRGETIDESTWLARDETERFADHTNADGIARYAPDLVFRHVPIEAHRRAVRAGERLTPPIDDLDVSYVELLGYDKNLVWLLANDPTSVLVRLVRARVQHGFDALVAKRRGEVSPVRFAPYEALMTGEPATALCRTPNPLFADTWYDRDASVPADCLALQHGFLVMFPYASVVVDEDGQVVDAFPTCGLRPVGASSDAILFVTGGGATASSGYFTPTPSVRDLATRSWVEGECPPGLPKYAAGTIGDVNWAIVADLQGGTGYRTAPGTLSDQCGGTFTSADNAYAYDGGDFVVACASGERVLDMRFFRDQVLGFARRDDGAWRFLVEPSRGGDDLLRVVDESGNVLCDLYDPAASLSPDGRTLLCVSREKLSTVDIDTGARTERFDMQALSFALALPDVDDELARNLLATFGTPERLARETPTSARAALAPWALYAEDIEEDALFAAIEVAASCPPVLGRRLPRIGAGLHVEEG